MHAVAPWDVHSCKHDCSGARERCERGAVARPVGERPRVGPDRALPPSPGRASPDDVRLRVVHLLASPPPLDPRILFHPTPDGPPSEAKIRSRIPMYAARRHDTSTPVRVVLSLVRYRRMSSIAESADPARLACGGIAPKRTLWPLWTAGRSLTVIHTSPRASIVS